MRAIDAIELTNLSLFSDIKRTAKIPNNPKLIVLMA